MKTKDFLIIALFPLAVLLIPLVAMQFTREVNWTASDFLAMWIVLSVPTFLFRLLVTRQGISLTYKLGAALGVVTGFFMTWVSLAVDIIGDQNPANLVYAVAILAGLIGISVSRFKPAGLANAAFACAAVTFLAPVVGLGWRADFAPGIPQVFLLNGCFVGGFAISGLLFRHAAGRPANAAVA